MQHLILKINSQGDVILCFEISEKVQKSVKSRAFVVVF